MSAPVEIMISAALAELGIGLKAEDAGGMGEQMFEGYRLSIGEIRKPAAQPVVERESPLFNQLEDDRGREGFAHAGEPEPTWSGIVRGWLCSNRAPGSASRDADGEEEKCRAPQGEGHIRCREVDHGGDSSRRGRSGVGRG
jgi:hypothetical protein